MIETKLASEPEQFQDGGAWHVGRRVTLKIGDWTYDVLRTWYLPDCRKGTVSFDSVLFQLAHGPLVFVDPAKLRPFPSSKIEEPTK